LKRSLILSDLGYTGVLHAEVAGEFGEVVGYDMLANIALNP